MLHTLKSGGGCVIVHFFWQKPTIKYIFLKILAHWKLHSRIVFFISLHFGPLRGPYIRPISKQVLKKSKTPKNLISSWNSRNVLFGPSPNLNGQSRCSQGDFSLFFSHFLRRSKTRQIYNIIAVSISISKVSKVV